MKSRHLGPFEVSAIGLGCMNLSHGYGAPPDAKSAALLLHRALDIGYRHLDTAVLYGFGANETLLGDTLHARRHEYVLASKCGIFRDETGKREIDGRPEVLTRTCEDSLRRLRTDVIDLYYLHRWDRRVPIEDSVGALADLVRAGKIRTIGLSEVSAATLRKAHAVHPITAIQTEYSIWTRNPEIKVLDECRRLGVGFVAFSPLGRGFLTGTLRDPTAYAADDLRHHMPRFQSPHHERNLVLADRIAAIAGALGCTSGQLALAWLLAQDPTIVPIPGTTSLAHLDENAAAAHLELDSGTVGELDAVINERTVSGARYSPAAQRETDTEEYAAAS
jgi:aryl-alcohol dehydrogenase-like predicted oxidoreductase